MGARLRRRIMFVVTELSRGGSETQIFRISRELRARGHEVWVVSMRAPRAYVEELERAGVVVRSLELEKDPLELARGLVWSFTRVILEARPEVLVGFLFHPNLAVRLHGRALGVPAIVTSIRSETFGSLRREQLERLLRSLLVGDQLVTNSRRVARQLVADGIVREGAVLTIGNAIDPAPYGGQSPEARAALRRALEVAPDEVAWLAVAGFRPVKDHPNMLRAFAHARRVLRARPDAPEIVLRVAGHGEPDEAWYALRAELGLEHHVRFIGTRDDVPALLQASDALVLSSRHEGLPNAVMEALAAGIPVASTDVGGVRELVKEGESGEVVPPGDPRALGDAIARLSLLDADARAQMGGLGRDHIARNYATGPVTSQWEACFEERLVAGRRRPLVRLRERLGV